MGRPKSKKIMKKSEFNAYFKNMENVMMNWREAMYINSPISNSDTFRIYIKEFVRSLLKTDPEAFISTKEVLEILKAAGKNLKDARKMLNHYIKAEFIAKPFIFNKKAYWFRTLSHRIVLVYFLTLRLKKDEEISEVLSKIKDMGDFTLLVLNYGILTKKYFSKLITVNLDTFIKTPFSELKERIIAREIFKEFTHLLCNPDIPVKDIDVEKIAKAIYKKRKNLGVIQYKLEKLSPDYAISNRNHAECSYREILDKETIIRPKRKRGNKNS